VFDNNQALYRGDIGITVPTPGRVVQEQIYSAKVPAYWLVNLDARVKLDMVAPALHGSYLQFNLYNAFDKFYVGGFGGGLAQSTSTRCAVSGQTPCLPANVVPTWGAPPFVQLGAPRTFMASLNVEF
jgi:iron complex outermembrane receptor protein